MNPRNGVSALLKTLTPISQLTGTGLHSGAPCAVEIVKAPAGSGIHLSKSGGSPVRLSEVSSVEMPLRTRVLVNEDPVDTVEHMMAGLAISKLTDITLILHGPEVPALDGSAHPWVLFFNSYRTLSDIRTADDYLEITCDAQYSFGDSEYALTPGITSITAEIDYSGTVIGRQKASFTEDEFELMSQARTFCLERDVEQMRHAGLGKGGSLDNAVVMGENGPLNPEGLRMECEFAAHKALDLYGDLFLSGARLAGSIHATRPGHTANAKLLAAALEDGVFRIAKHSADRNHRLSA